MGLVPSPSLLAEAGGGQVQKLPSTPEYSLRPETSFLAVYSWPGSLTPVQGALHQVLMSPPQRC